MKTIIIETLGKSGNEVAFRVSQETGLPLIDSKTILDTAETLGADVAYLKHFEEKNFGSLIYALFSSANRHEQRPVQKAYSALAESIRILYRKNNGCIFMGRFAGGILSEFDSLVKAFIYSSPVELSEDSLTRQNISEILMQQENALNHEKSMALQYDSENYDIILNTAVTSCEECAKSIIQLAQG